MLTYHQTTEAEKYRITAWEYEGEYAIYNATPYAEQKKKGFGCPRLLIRKHEIVQ